MDEAKHNGREFYADDGIFKKERSATRYEGGFFLVLFFIFLGP